MNKKEKKEFKKAWIKALRSNEYKQGRGCLVRKNRYCCLGVALDLGFIPGQWERRGNSGWFFVSEGSTLEEVMEESGNQIGTMPTLDQTIKLGLDVAAPQSPSMAYRLAAMNDDGISFEKIADYIEKNF